MPVASQAEAYANAHHPHPKRDKGKPLFDWITRKLGGGGRRATIAHSEVVGERGSTSQDIQSEHSLRSVERRRQERNNPYANVPLPRRASTAVSSFLSRSDSELSRRTDDNASIDDNVSTRPIPPSHSSSPVPSTVMSPSASASLLSPKPPKRHSASSASLDKSISTKPTTVSFDSGPPVAPIAQTPTAVSPANRVFPHHQNPHPLAPPDPNASTVTLASSHMPSRKPQGDRSGIIASPSVTWAPETNDRMSDHYAPSGLSMKPRITDKDASLRAVRRRGSGESDGSKWSWRPPPEVRDGIVV